MSVPGSTETPLRVAVVGSGPSGFYAAQGLFDADVNVAVAMYDRLPAPFGLVRYGVAPDHAKIKNAIKVYEKTASHERFSFFGNVTVARDISVSELLAFHDAVIIASGAETDRRLGIPGEELPGSYTATEFVAWYNGHPDYQDRSFDLSGGSAVVIGQGNVAMDVCRLLCKTADELRATDITERALDALSESRVREVHMIGRRGPAQAAFTPAEIKEFATLADCDPVVDPADLAELSAASQEELEDRNRKRNFAVLEQFAAMGEARKGRRFAVHFCKSPREIRGEGNVQSVVLERTALEGAAGAQRAAGTGVTEELPCDVFFRSVGYLGVPLEGVPFCESTGTIPNERGRVLGADGQPLSSLYVAGWIKRGPTGIIGTNKPDSLETVRNLLADVDGMTPCENRSDEAVRSLLTSRGVRAVSYGDWREIDRVEVERGASRNKPREKITAIDEMLAVIDRNRAR